MNEYDQFKESKRQKDQLENIFQYLKETDPSCLCLKGEGVIPTNYVWLSALNFSLIDLKPLVDKIKELTISHLRHELVKLNCAHEAKRQRQLIFTHQD